MHAAKTDFAYELDMSLEAGFKVLEAQHFQLRHETGQPNELTRTIALLLESSLGKEEEKKNLQYVCL